MKNTSKYHIDITLNKENLKKLLLSISKIEYNANSYKKVEKVMRKFPGANGKLFSKSQLITAYKSLQKELNLTPNNNKNLLLNIKMKEVRTISGVTPVTVLTKPYPCPGKCIFCPNDTKMPKSYLVNEPGAQRALANKFDPYSQTINRLIALHNIGHAVSKIELIVLGGTWSSYPQSYQIWFINRCFVALNDFSKNPTNTFFKTKNTDPINSKNLVNIKGENLSSTVSYNRVIAGALKISKQLKETETWANLEKSQKINEKAKVRCIGLSIETRPDEINEHEVVNIRKLGATKVQLGVQSLNNTVLKLNKRGHTIAQTAYAFNLLRKAGFKIQIHYMPNLYGSSVKKDIADFKKLFSNKNFKPDEIKLYPCSLISSAELINYYNKKLWVPYTKNELLKVLLNNLKSVKEYCRVTRVIRDIPSQDIVFGNKLTNFRQIVETYAKNKNISFKEIRNREVKNTDLKVVNYKLKVKKYKTQISTEYFLSYVDNNFNIAGFLRLSLPINTKNNFIKELNNTAIIREIHIYGNTVDVGKKTSNKAQHMGFGKKLIEYAEKLALKNNFNKLTVISSIGTREYYKKRGFTMGTLYQHKKLK